MSILTFQKSNSGHKISKQIITTRQHLLIIPQPRESLRSSLEAGVMIHRAELLVHSLVLKGFYMPKECTSLSVSGEFERAKDFHKALTES